MDYSFEIQNIPSSSLRQIKRYAYHMLNTMLKVFMEMTSCLCVTA